MDPPASVTIDCPAKINLALSVARPPATDPAGLHPIASWMSAIDLYDRLTVERAEGQAAGRGRPSYDIGFADDAPSARQVDWPIEDDLVFRAHRLLEGHTARALPMRVTVKKRIPTGAGLGGGSSDAAGLIEAASRLFGLTLTADDRRRLAAGLGSDVHFAAAALAGQTSAVVSGSGDVVEPVARHAAWPIQMVLVLPDFGCPTGPVYAAFDRLPNTPAPRSPHDLQTLAQRFVPGVDGLFNDLTAAAIAVEPRLGDLLNNLRQHTPHPVHVTGSGAACFVVVGSVDEAQTLAGQIVRDLDVSAIATRTV